MRRRMVTTTLTIGVVALVASCTTAGVPPTDTAATVSATGPTITADQDGTADVGERQTATTALALLDTVEVRGRAPSTGYDPDEFGPAWTDDVTVQGGHNGCDTRNDILRRDLTHLVVEPTGCVASTGTLPDPYTGEHLPFVRGEDSGSQIHIDHIVSLSNAWQTGAQQLLLEQRTNLANDPLNLWAVSGWTNQQKGDGDAATWLPPNKAIRCHMVARQVAVKAKYELWVTQPEAEAIRRVLGDCPNEPVPTNDD